MTRTKRILRAATLSLGVLLLVGAAGWYWFMREFRLKISSSDVEPLEVILKKAASDVVAAKRPDSKPTSLSGGYLVAYQRDPESFHGDAKLFDAWMTSVKLGSAALKNPSRGNWVRSSAEADYVASQDRVDPWNHTLCLLRRDDDVLVVSGGPRAPGSPACRNIQLQAMDLAEFPREKLLESPAGYLMLVVTKAATD